MRRELSLSLKMITPLKFNHDVVVPKGRIPELFALVERIRDATTGLRIPCFGHAGDGNIHVNIMVTRRRGRDRARARSRARAVRGRRGARGLDQRRARHRLLEGAVPAARAVSRRDRADEAGQAGVRSGRHPESRIFPSPAQYEFPVRPRAAGRNVHRIGQKRPHGLGLHAGRRARSRVLGDSRYALLSGELPGSPPVR